MTEQQKSDFNRMWTALQRIIEYQDPETLRENSQKDWGLDFEEAIEMAYENIQEEARQGVQGINRVAIGA